MHIPHNTNMIKIMHCDVNESLLVYNPPFENLGYHKNTNFKGWEEDRGRPKKEREGILGYNIFLKIFI